MRFNLQNDLIKIRQILISIYILKTKMLLLLQTLMHPRNFVFQFTNLLSNRAYRILTSVYEASNKNQNVASFEPRNLLHIKLIC